MAIIKCPECGHDISDKAEICIHCGYPIGNALLEEMQPPESKDDEVVDKLERAQEICGYAEELLDQSKSIISALADISDILDNDEWD